jgi:hypothetical protein
MADQQTQATAGAGRGWLRTDRGCLLVLALFVLGVRAWQLTHTEVLARDSIGYIRIAWQLQHGNLLQVLPKSTQHPLYPLTVLAASVPVRHYLHADLPRVMQLSAQLASAAASVLLVVPMFYLGRELFGRRVGFGAALFFQCLPAAGRVLGDGLSEALFLLCASSGLYFAARGLRGRSAVPFALAGLCSGLAYLTRPEGLLVAGASGLVLLAAQAVAGWRWTRRQFLKCGVCLAAAVVVVAAPYMLTIGGFTVKRTGKIITHAEDPDPPPAGFTPDLGAAPAAPVLAGPLFAVWHIDQSPNTLPTSGWALRSLAEVLARGFFHVGWVPALVGLWCLRGRFGSAPGLWVLLVVMAVLAGVLFKVAAAVGYLSDRHTLLLILCGTYWSVTGLGVLGDGLARWVARRPAWHESRWAGGGAWAAALLLVLSAVPLAKTMEPLHKDRAGFRVAGYWLAEHAWAGDKIDDPYAWSNYYAGHVFVEVREEVGLPWGPGPAHQPPVRYVVQEVSSNPHRHLNLEPEEALRAQGGHVAQRWMVRRGKEDAQVVVWSVPAR